MSKSVDSGVLRRPVGQVLPSLARGPPGSGGGRRWRARPFCFFSVFKWEWRKGWDVLLSADWDEFTL